MTAADPIPAPEDLVPERDVLAEQVRMIRRMTMRSALSTLLFSVLVAAVLYRLGPPIAIWMGVQILLKLVSYVELRWFFSETAIAEHPEAMARRMMITQAPHAVGWAALAGLCAMYGTPAELVFSIMVIGGMMSGGVTTFGPLPRVHAVYLAAFICTQGVIYLLLRAKISDNVYSEFAPLLTSFFCVAIFLNTRIAGRTYHEFILRGFANAQLAQRLEQEVASTRLAQREAETANAAKSTFLASASHDLRQPIHALGMFLALLERSGLTPAQRETLGLATASLTASREMLDALLDFSRAEAGVIVPRVQPFAIGPILHEIESEIAVGADEKRLFYRTRECAGMVESDPALVKIILQNLTLNAIRYTEKGGVLVGCRRRGDRLVIEVWDSGQGIAADQWDAIFSDFIQLGNPERDRRKGLGLGLAIARRLARLIGSEITLDSRVGKGSVFRFTLPLSGAEIRPGQHRVASPESGPSRTGHVLVLDDDEAVRLGLGALLRETGHSVDAAETIAEAQAQVRHTVPDLLICDYRLRAGESGVEAARLLREQIGRRVPALLITGDTHPDRIAEATRSDMEILYKPVQPVLLLDTIGRLLAREVVETGQN